MKYRVLIAQFPGNNSTKPSVGDWIVETAVKMDRDERIGRGNWGMWRKADTPITMSRNICLKFAHDQKYDFVVMVHSDMQPDFEHGAPHAKPFWESSFEFAINHNGPCAIAAPYCGPPPFEMPYVFNWTNKQTDDPNPNFQIEAYSRHEASALSGIQRAAALPTGLILLDTRGTRRLHGEMFYYEWADDGPPCHSCGQRIPGERIQKGSTEDVAFSRDLATMGVPLYANWDSWAGHWKEKLVGRPYPLGADVIPRQLRGRAAEVERDGIIVKPEEMKIVDEHKQCTQGVPKIVIKEPRPENASTIEYVKTTALDGEPVTLTNRIAGQSTTPKV